MPLHLRDQKSMMNLTQFEATIWAKHNTQWRSNKWEILRMKMKKSQRKRLTMSLNQTNATNVAMPLFGEAI